MSCRSSLESAVQAHQAQAQAGQARVTAEILTGLAATGYVRACRKRDNLLLGGSHSYTVAMRPRSIEATYHLSEPLPLLPDLRGRCRFHHRPPNVRLALDSGHCADIPGRPSCAKGRHSRHHGAIASFLLALWFNSSWHSFCGKLKPTSQNGPPHARPKEKNRHEVWPRPNARLLQWPGPNSFSAKYIAV